jgi:hypothetical protein
VIAVAIGLFFAVRPSTTHTQPSGTPPPAVVADPRAATVRVVNRLFDAAPTPPDATPVSRSPLPILNHPPSIPGSSNLITRTTWWTTQAAMSDVLSYFSAHLPTGIEQGGSSSSGDRNGETSRGLTFDGSGPRWARPRVYTQLELLVTVAPLTSGSGTGVRMDVHAIWIPQRTTGQRIPLDVTSVDVVVGRTDRAPTVRRTLSAADARSLARVVNELPVFPPGTYNCPIDRGFVDTLTFHAAQRLIIVRATVEGCGGVTVKGSGTRGPGLSGGGGVDLAVLRLLDLPRTYGR